MKLCRKRIAALGRVVTGKTPPTERPEYFDGEYLFVTPSDLDFRTYYCRNTERSVSEAAKSVLANQFIPADAVMFTCIGATIGKCALSATECLTNQQINSIIASQDTDPRFLYYSLCHNIEVFRALGGGAATPILNKSKFEAVELLMPDYDNQRGISRILAAYDDLIENNRRRMALLEESARLLYREWFVRLRFPGHERTRTVDGLPDGWQRAPLGKITTKIGSGATPRGGEASYFTEGITLIRSLNVYNDRFYDDGLAFIGQDQAAALDNVTVEPRDILLNITGASVARCCMAPERYLPARVNQHVMILRVDPSEADPFFVHAAINSDERKRQLLSYAQKGSTREALTKDMMAAFEITLPSKTLMEQFGENAATSFLQRENLALQNQKLKAARDLLLPRLMSGEIVV